MTHACLEMLVAPTTVHSAGPTLEETLGEFRRRTGTNAAVGMNPAAAGEFFGGTRVDLGADDALAVARDFAPELVIAEPADFLGPLAASRLRVPRARHGVGVALEASVAEAMHDVAGARLAERGIALSRPCAPVDPRPGCLQHDAPPPCEGRITKGLRRRRTSVRVRRRGGHRDAGEAGEAVVRVLEDSSYRAAARTAARHIAAMAAPDEALSLLIRRLG
ncbi:hypothetical protein AB0A94_03065 [Streptomyces sp. NPDC044984]|uniref:hypothetical protein n=1 Tax=Streptomyces sp. NPDC044984 TaxID=3154335 RepID=UPI0033D82B29